MTTLTLTITKTHCDQIKKESWFVTPDEYIGGTGLFRPRYRDFPEAVNRVDLIYRDTDQLDFLPYLESLGIAYDLCWREDEQRQDGGVYHRYGPTGTADTITLEINGEHPPMDECLARIDDPDALRQFILDHQQATQVPAWKHQIEFGKRYRARELLKHQ